MISKLFIATHVHKVTNVPVYYMALGLNDFDGGKSITRVMALVMDLPASRAIKKQVH